MGYIDQRLGAKLDTEMINDEAVDFIEDLEEADQRAVLDVMPVQERVLLEDSLRFLEDSAGRLRRDAATISLLMLDKHRLHATPND